MCGGSGMRHVSMRSTAIGLAVIAALILTGGTSASVVLSGNLLAGPASDFENAAAALKLTDSPLTPAEQAANTQPVRAWQFHPDFDLGIWIGNFGASAVDDPRAAWPDTPTAPTNISEDPLNPGNHVIEGALFRATAGLILKAPDNHAPGAGYIDFDYYWNNWTAPGTHDAASIFKIWVYGFNEVDLPSWNDRWGPTNNGPANGGGQYDGFVWTNPNWSEWGWTGPGDDEDPIASLGNQWNTLSDTDPGRTTLDITEAYDYYYIALYMVTYAEGSPYFWLYNPPKPSDSMAVAVDNIIFQLPVTGDDCPVPDPVLGDFSGDAQVNTADINPFILALTNLQAWLDYIGPILGECLTDEQLIAYADPNQDGQINTADIVPFINLLTGGAPAIIPEPGSIALLGLGAMALLRRRR
jgi:hypothetical protein